MNILLTGGLGYIGSHIAKLLGHDAIIIDNKVNSSLNYKKYLPNSIVYENDLNIRSLNKIFNQHEIKGVIHLAGLKAVNESLKDPLKYYRVNVGSSMDLMESMEKFRINNLIFSSSATVYGNKQKSPLKEEMELEAVNTYGSTKIIIEQLIRDFSNKNPKFKAISLRYFNPLGADNIAGLSEKPLGKPLNLMPTLLKSVKEKKKFKIFGKNYKTKDGTCIRDYIHVKDIANAHLIAFKKLKKIKGYHAINLGLGKGVSVLEIIKIFESVNKVKVPFFYTSRRAGDSAESFADNRKARKLLGWKPMYSYKDMVLDAWLAGLKK
tara:strand:- start:1524 stop:2489 length:966 start_codon:yes stop_codon:yes gene_type:complete